MQKAFLLYVLIIISVTAFSQDSSVSAAHGDHRFEAGAGLSAVHFFGEENYSPSLHMHLIKSTGSGGFGLGIEYEYIFDVHRHNTIGVVTNFILSDKFSLSLSPGIAFESMGDEPVTFALHAEALYEWEVGKIHLGPVIGIGYEIKDVHVSAGIHLGFGF